MYFNHTNINLIDSISPNPNLMLLSKMLFTIEVHILQSLQIISKLFRKNLKVFNYVHMNWSAVQ